MTRGPGVARLPRALLDAIVAHARADAPLESCGLVIGSAARAAGGEPRRYVPCRNRLASRYRYEIHPEDLVREVTAADAVGEAVWGIVHSHVGTPAVPSATDIGLATWPGTLQLVVSLAGGGAEVRAWRIAGDAALELHLEVA